MFMILTGNEHILFVDDDSMIVKMGSRILERLGYTVTGITSSQDALELFKENASSNAISFDLIITDMTMPHLTGDILVMEIRKTRPEIPIILCTGYSSRINQESARDISINTFLNKPISKLELSSTVREVIDTTFLHQMKKKDSTI
jgi:CheY-like chemotaxis protein